MDVISTSSSPSIGRSLPLLPRPEPKEIPYMIEILKEMWKVNCEKDYSDRMESLYRHNKLNTVSSAQQVSSFFFNRSMHVLTRVNPFSLQNTLRLITKALSEIILLTWMHDINESNDWHVSTVLLVFESYYVNYDLTGTESDHGYVQYLHGCRPFRASRKASARERGWF